MRVRRPVIELNAVGSVQSHGPQTPVRGVWHDTECGDAHGISELEGVVNYWRSQDRGYGAHLIIDKDGNTAFCVDPSKVSWAVENHNTGTVSVELIGFARFNPQVWVVRRRQLDKLAKWMAWLRIEYGVPLVRGVNSGWSGHDDQTKAFGGSHYDPGLGFPKQSVINRAHKYMVNGW